MRMFDKVVIVGVGLIGGSFCAGSRCTDQRTLNTDRAGPLATTHSTTSGNDVRPRNAATCIGGSGGASSFSMASINENAPTAPSMDRMPRLARWSVVHRSLVCKCGQWCKDDPLPTARIRRSWNRIASAAQQESTP